MDSLLEPSYKPYFRTFEEISKWLKWDSQSRDNVSTAFARVKNTWHCLVPYAKVVSPAFSVEWEQDHQVFSFTDGHHSTPQRMALSTIINTARYFNTRVQESLYSIFPPCFSRLDLGTLNLKDDLTGTPIFQQEVNFIITKPIINKLHHLVLKSGVRTRDRHKVQSFLKKEQEFLQVLLVAITLTIGIPPQRTDLAEIRYKGSSDGTQCRNIVLSNGGVLLATPQKRINGRIFPASVWSFPPEVGDALTIYICIVRPTAIKLMETIGEKPHRDLFTHLFGYNHARRPGKCAWSTRRISEIIENTTEQHTQVRLMPTHLSGIMKAIYRHYFPLMNNTWRVKSSTTSANSQAGHTQITSDLNYGLSTNLPPGISMTSSTFSFLVEKSRAWHAIIGTSPSQWSLAENMERISVVKHTYDQIATLHRARWVVCRSYDFSGTLERNATRTRAAEILRRQPFLKFPLDVVCIKRASLYSFG